MPFNHNYGIYLLLCLLWAQDSFGFVTTKSGLKSVNDISNSLHTDTLALIPNLGKRCHKLGRDSRTTLSLFNSNNNEEEPYILSMIEDKEVLAYDIFLILNLFVAISTFVTHRSSPLIHMNEALSNGSLFAICWILAGVYHGAFLFSSSNNPFKAGTMALTTFISTCNIRLVLELLFQSLVLHQKLEFEWLEFVVGITLMSSWRWLHSAYVNRYWFDWRFMLVNASILITFDYFLCIVQNRYLDFF